jgi:hypothetical protein
VTLFTDASLMLHEGCAQSQCTDSPCHLCCTLHTSGVVSTALFACIICSISQPRCSTGFGAHDCCKHTCIPSSFRFFCSRTCTTLCACHCITDALFCCNVLPSYFLHTNASPPIPLLFFCVIHHLCFITIASILMYQPRCSAKL